MGLHPSIVFIAGLVIIILGAEFVLRGASRVAARLGIRPIVIGLTVVSIGTSMPELAVGITAAAENRSTLAVGNIAGTNILNILFILGLSAALRPLKLQQLSIRFDVPVMIASAVVLFIMAYDGTLSRYEGIFLVAASVAYTISLVRISRNESAKLRQEYAEEFSPKALLKEKNNVLSWLGNITLLITGLGLSVLGADLLVAGAVKIAQDMGVSDAIIGLTIVAVGTSAPELATTVVATIKNDRDVAIGNLIGSSITNILFILGVTCVVAPRGVDVSRDVLWLDLPLAAAVAIVCYPIFRSDQMVTRREGIAFVVTYLLYMAFLLYRA